MIKVLDKDLEELGLNAHTAMESCWMTLEQSYTLSLTYFTGLLWGENGGEENYTSCCGKKVGYKLNKLTVIVHNGAQTSSKLFSMFNSV